MLYRLSPNANKNLKLLLIDIASFYRIVLYNLFFLNLFLIYSCGKHEPLFEKIDENKTGIHFVNKNVDSDTLNILDYLYYYNGAGVAIGDINNDGLPDIYLASNQNGNKLYLNKGDFKFEDITQKAGVAGNADWTTGVTMADVNGDGWLDIYVCTVANHKLPGRPGESQHTYFPHSKNQLFINNHNGTFTECAAKWGLDASGYSTQAVFFDYDKDGDLDMFLLQHSVHQTDSYGDTSSRSRYSAISGGKLFRNDGDHFTDVTKQSGIIASPLGYGLGVGVADINQDGWDDIYVSNDFHENDYYYVNQGNGTFKEMNKEAFGHESKFSMGNDIADINNDGWPDIITLDMLPEDEGILKSSVGDEPLDLYLQRRAMGYHYQYSRNCLQLNIGKGKRFSDIAPLSGVMATDWSWAALIADFDQDGYEDIFISNGIKRRENDLDYLNFISNDEIRKSNMSSKMMDKAMIEKMPEGKWHNYIFKGSDSLIFTDKSKTWGFGQATLSNGAAYADLDNDGDLDLVTNDINEPAGVYRNNAGQILKNNYLRLKFKGDDKNTFGIGSKVFLFAGGKIFFQELQTTRGFMSSVEPVLTFGLGKIQKIDTMVVIWPDNHYQVLFNLPVNKNMAIKQTDGRGKLTDHFSFISHLLKTDSARLFQNITPQTKVDFAHRENISFIDFNKQPLIPHEVSTMGPKIAIGDVNGDGLQDFFVCGTRDAPGKLYIQKSDGTFQPSGQNAFSKDSAADQVDAIFFDADNDGDLDLYIASGGNEYASKATGLKDHLYINNGKGEFFESLQLPALYQNKSVVRAADFNGDGYMDLFVGGRANAVSYGGITLSYLLQNDGKGGFRIVTDSIAKGLGSIGMVTDACWADLNKDGKPDLIVVGEWMAPSIFMNEEGKLVLLKNDQISSLTGWWTCIKNVDINGDGYDDLLLGNYGLNSKLKASAQYPLKMYYGDFDHNGIADQILAISKNGKYYPFLGKEELEKHLPYLKREFLSYSKMAGKTVEEIFGPRLNNSPLFQASTFQSIVLINDRRGGFYEKPLPTFMQMAPIFSFFADDFNHDGKTDIIAGGNFFGVAPYEGRYDAMPPTIGYGNGEGDFHCTLPYPDQLLIQGEFRDIKCIKVKNKKTLILARNNDSLIFLSY